MKTGKQFVSLICMFLCFITAGTGVSAKTLSPNGARGIALPSLQTREDDGQTIPVLPDIEIPGDQKAVPEGYREVESDSQSFATICLENYETQWEEDDGLYIYTGGGHGIPYVLIYRYRDMPVNNVTFLDDHIVPHMVESYGDRLINISRTEDYTFGDKTLPGIDFTYMVGDYVIHSLRLCEQAGDDVINYTAKYIDGMGDVTMNALTDAVNYFHLTDEPASAPSGSPKVSEKPVAEEKSFEIVPDETAQVQYEKYEDPSGYFTMDIPKGWKVEIGLPPTGEVDLISYALHLYDPEKPERQLYYNMVCVAGLKSQEARDWFSYYYGTNNIYSQLAVLPSVTAEGFYTAFEDIYGYENFRASQSVLDKESGIELLTANCTCSENGSPMTGAFMVALEDFTYFVQRDVFDYSKGTLDVGWINAYNVLFETSGADEWFEWQPVLDHCLASLSFSKSFKDARRRAWEEIIQTSEYFMLNGSDLSDMFMDFWNRRNTSQDVLSQKRSDASLGYERVFDTELDEYYKAENGFSDWYDGTRYVPVDSDEAYLSPISGYINWK